MRPGRGLALVATFAVAALVGVGGLLGVAAVSAEPVAFLGAGLVVFLAASIGGVALVTRRWPGRAVARRQALLIGTTTGILLFVATVLVPWGGAGEGVGVRADGEAADRVAGQTSVQLGTGSRLTYVRIPATAPSRGVPVVFLHGGPGVPDLAGDSAYFGQLARAGFDVYVYAQVGSGPSERLDDSTEYTLSRHVADLEAFRRHIGAERLIVIGHSYGSAIASAYVADHPDRVARAVYASPHPLDPAVGGISMVGRLDGGRKVELYGQLLRPRGLLAYTLLQINPHAAHEFIDDPEMDRRFAVNYNLTRPALHCPGKPGPEPGPELHDLGFYANAYPQSATRAPVRDRRPAFARAQVPGLVIKGECDYVSWSSALGYLEGSPRSALIYLRGAGHNVYQDRPEAFLDAVRAFLTGEPLPQEPYRGRRPPPSFVGPACGHGRTPGRR